MAASKKSKKSKKNASAGATRNSYTDEQKAEIVDGYLDAKERGENVTQKAWAASYGVSFPSFGLWLKQRREQEEGHTDGRAVGNLTTNADSVVEEEELYDEEEESRMAAHGSPRLEPAYAGGRVEEVDTDAPFGLDTQSAYNYPATPIIGRAEPPAKKKGKKSAREDQLERQLSNLVSDHNSMVRAFNSQTKDKERALESAKLTIRKQRDLLRSYRRTIAAQCSLIGEVLDDSVMVPAGSED